MKQTGFLKVFLLSLSVFVLVLVGCGSSSGNKNDDANESKGTVLLDSPLVGVTYVCEEPKDPGVVKKTDSEGRFECDKAPVTFKIGGLVLGSIDNLDKDFVIPQDILGLKRSNFTDPKLIALLRLLQSMDDDGNISETITITEEMSHKFDAVDEEFNADHLDVYAGKAGIDVLVTEEEARGHLILSIKNTLSTMPRSHDLDGKTLYMTGCTYSVSDRGVEYDAIGGIRVGPNMQGSETIVILKFENGFVVQMSVVGSPEDVGNNLDGAPGMYYQIGAGGFNIGPISDGGYSLLKVSKNYYLDISANDRSETLEVVSFFDTPDEARAYIQKVYSKVERTCEVTR